MHRSGTRYLTAGMVATVCAFATVNLSGVSEAAPCAVAIERAAAEAGTPRSILQAIGTVESSGHPWAVNDGGRSYLFNTRAEASAFLHNQIERGRTNLDIGCLQINWHWHRDQLGSPDTALDPSTNALYAALYLRSLYDAFGSWSAAVGAYHSRRADRAEHPLPEQEDHGHERDRAEEVRQTQGPFVQAEAAADQDGERGVGERVVGVDLGVLRRESRRHPPGSGRRGRRVASRRLTRTGGVRAR